MNYIGLLFNLFKLKRNTKRTREQIQKLQNKKLRRILRYAYLHCAYYHRVFSEHGINENNINSLPISSFPTIDKNIFIQNYDDIVVDQDMNQDLLRRFDESETLDHKILKGKYHVVHSSGSTGKPAYFIYDDKAWNDMLIGIIRGALWDMSMLEIIKLLLNGPKIVYVAATDGRYGGAMAVSAGIEGVHAKQLSLDVNMPVQEWIEKVRKFNPNIIIGYPSAIKILAELVEQKRLEIKPVRIITCGEPLNKNLRDYLKKQLTCPIVNFYGASESLALGVEISNHDGMYLFDDLNYVEIEDDHIYITSLYNYSQPLIRYRLSDRLKIKEQKSTYPFTRIENILGRHEDMMWFERDDGTEDFLHPLAIEGFVDEGMLDFQFHQISKRAFEMWIQSMAPSFRCQIRHYIEKKMKGILKDKDMEFIDFKIRFVDEIYPDARTGKKSLIVKEMNK